MRRSSVASNLHRLRAVIADVHHTKDQLHGYIIPSEDAHQSEYVAPCDRRRAFACGFTGSHGTAVITKNKAALWTDSRYFIQAEKELYPHWSLMKEGVPDEVTVADWLTEAVPGGGNIGIDPLYISTEHWEELEKDLNLAGYYLLAVEENLVDLVWLDRPQPPSHHINTLSIHFSGKLWIEKIYEVREQMKQFFAGMLIVTALDEVAWLLNLRGSDIEYNPVFFGYIIVTMNAIFLFVNTKKLASDVATHLHSIDVHSIVEYHPYTHVKKHIRQLVKTVDGKIWISKASSYALTSLVPKNRRCISEDSPIAALKAVKNPTEVSGMRDAHIKDGAALCEFWAWMDKEVPKGTVTELSAAHKLLHFLKAQENFVGLSFGTCAQSGPNSASPHYEPSADMDSAVTVNEIFLCDSGSQYRDGTTDISRVFHFGTPTDYEKECFTAVLKGHIALTGVIFPPFTKGCMVDSFARTALWDIGLNFMHATGHGVGSFLNVHEGPTTISPRCNPHDPGMQAGMCLTNEPGYYEEDKFGIRIESLMVVKKVPTKGKTIACIELAICFRLELDHAVGALQSPAKSGVDIPTCSLIRYHYLEDDYLGFEVLSLVPIQTKMINRSMLEKHEVNWLNNYHRQCREVVGPVLESKGRQQAHEWLMKETEPIG